MKRRHIGYNGKRRKIKRLLAHFHNLNDRCSSGYNSFDLLEPIAQRIWNTALSIPSNDMIWDSIMPIFEVLQYHDYEGYRDEALRGTY